jgi:hypothetical protein
VQGVAALEGDVLMVEGVSDKAFGQSLPIRHVRGGVK